ncbi:MAG: DinB family protein [Acidobacteria bacterium]|nr:DinB family protein [Acidobacteriota bacterium]
MPIADGLLPEFDHETTTTRKVLDRAPEDRFDWTPHPKSFSLGALASHVANLPAWGADVLTTTEFDVAAEQPPVAPTSKAALLATFDDNVAATRSALVGKTDEELQVMWSLTRGDTAIFSMPRAGVLRSFVLNHLIHHRGQLSVYLRLLDVPVPSIYGPSADEPSF